MNFSVGHMLNIKLELECIAHKCGVVVMPLIYAITLSNNGYLLARVLFPFQTAAVIRQTHIM